jgi:hypothetical protein
MGSFGCCDLVGINIFQGEHDVDPLDHQHTFFNLDFAPGERGQPLTACADLARLQRAT